MTDKRTCDNCGLEILEGEELFSVEDRHWDMKVCIRRLRANSEQRQRQLQKEREDLSERVEELEKELTDIREQFHTQEQRNVEQRQVLVRMRNRDVKRLRERIQAVVNALHRLPIVPNAGEWGEERYEAFWAAIHELEQGASDD